MVTYNDMSLSRPSGNQRHMVKAKDIRDTFLYTRCTAYLSCRVHTVQYLAPLRMYRLFLIQTGTAGGALLPHAFCRG